jgi:hypothetical protein
MKKYWPLLLIMGILAAIVCMSQYADSAKRRYEESARQTRADSVAKDDDGKATATNDAKDAYEPPIWAKYVTWPEGVGAWAVILTLLAIAWQSAETHAAARATQDSVRAAEKQTEHIITSERAWMIAEAGDAGIPPEIEGATGIRWTEFSVRFVNKGKTPAFLLEVGYCGQVLPYGEKLPTVQPPYREKEISKWEGKGLPLLPGAAVHKNHVGTWANDPVKITRGFDVLWVYGYIKYGDAFGFVRETWYCYRWIQEIERYQASGFIAGGPESYNHAT